MVMVRDRLKNLFLLPFFETREREDERRNEGENKRVNTARTWSQHSSHEFRIIRFLLLSRLPVPSTPRTSCVFSSLPLFLIFSTSWGETFFLIFRLLTSCSCYDFNQFPFCSLSSSLRICHFTPVNILFWNFTGSFFCSSLKIQFISLFAQSKFCNLKTRKLFFFPRNKSNFLHGCDCPNAILVPDIFQELCVDITALSQVIYDSTKRWRTRRGQHSDVDRKKEYKSDMFGRYEKMQCFILLLFQTGSNEGNRMYQYIYLLHTFYTFSIFSHIYFFFFFGERESEGVKNDRTWTIQEKRKLSIVLPQVHSSSLLSTLYFFLPSWCREEEERRKGWNGTKSEGSKRQENETTSSILLLLLLSRSSFFPVLGSSFFRKYTWLINPQENHYSSFLLFLSSSWVSCPSFPSLGFD